MKIPCPVAGASDGQRGATVVEFALISFFFFTLLFGIIELGRLMYVWNTVQEVTRRAAREAVVRNFTSSDQEALQREAVFRSAGGNGVVYLPFGPEINNASVRISYLYDMNPAHVVSPLPGNPKENISACADAGLTQGCIRYVRAEVCDGDNCEGVLYRPMIGFLLAIGGIDFRVRIPVSPVVMPAESLGFDPFS